MIDRFWPDIRYAFRVLLKKPGFSLLAVLTLSLGIGANTAIFSVVNEVLLKPLPYRDSEKLVKVHGYVPNRGWRTQLSYQNFLDLRKQNRVFSSFSAYHLASANLASDSGPERIEYASVSDDFFSVLSANPIMGRTFLPEENTPGRGNVVILSHGLWLRRFGGDSSAIGKQLLLDGIPHAVVGVMPAAFHFPQRETALWKPIALNPEMSGSRDSYWLQGIARIKPDVTLQEATTDLQTIAGRLAQQYPDTNRDWSVQLVSLHEDQVGKVRKAILILWGAVGLVLLIACANVANLFLVRATERRREIALRFALGGSPARVFRQLMVECLLIGLFAGIGGFLIAFWGVSFLPVVSQWNIVQQTQIHPQILLYSLGLSVLTGILFGIFPALQGSRTDLNQSLKSGGRGATTAKDRAGRLIVVSEIALTFVLLVTAGLLIRSFITLFRVDPGFDRQNLLTFRVAPPKSQPQPDESLESFLSRFRKERLRMSEFYRQLHERLQNLPGVESTGAIHSLPFAGKQWFLDFVRESSTEKGEAYGRVVSDHYFETLGVRLLQGRYFRPSDDSDSLPVAVINEAVAKKYWGGQNALGQRIRFGDDPEIYDWVEIVGIVSNVRNIQMESEPEPTVYVPMSQAMFGYFKDWGMTLIVRARTDIASLMQPIREQIRSLDPTLPAYEMKTMEQVMGDSATERRVQMVLLSFFSALALVLAVIGIYGVISYSVNHRTQEIGTRMALGAQTHHVLRMVLREGMNLTLAGLAIGLVLALMLGRVTSSLLYNVRAYDPTILCATALVFLFVSILACALPARRAAHVDPIRTLRYE